MEETLQLHPAQPGDGARVRAFYDSMTDAMADAPYPPGWRKGVYPTRAFLDAPIAHGELFLAEPDGRDGHVHPNATGDFRYFDTLFKVGNEYYTGVINIMPVNKGLLLKDITKIRNVTKGITGSYGENPQSRFLRDASMSSIRSSGGNSQEKSGESALYQRRDDTRTDRDVLSDAADGDAANVRETVTGAACSAIWTEYKSSGCIAWMQPLLFCAGFSTR